MPRLFIIYLHKNIINGKCYVGQTCQNPNIRWGKDGNHYVDQPYFYSAIQKYGWNNFEHIILEDNIPEDEVNNRECYWGDYYNSLYPNGYNFKLGNNEHIKNAEELKLIFSQASKKKWENEEYRKKVIEGRKRMWEEADEDIKNKMLKNLDRSGKGGKARSKKVLCVETNIIYESTRKAEDETGVAHTGISQVCNGKRYTAGGYHWKYVD